MTDSELKYREGMERNRTAVMTLGVSSWRLDGAVTLKVGDCRVVHRGRVRMSWWVQPGGIKSCSVTRVSEKQPNDTLGA